MGTDIQWTDETWNPVTGCTKVSPGCANCYIEKTPPFRMKGIRFERGRIPVTLHYDRLDQPLHWRKPRRVFVCSMADLFHKDVPDTFIAKVWGRMHSERHHVFQVLTKRPERMRRWLARCSDGGGLGWMTHNGEEPLGYRGEGIVVGIPNRWPLPNVWLGVSAENQFMLDKRIPILLDTPAAVRFVSCEPLLGPLDLRLRDSLRCHCGEVKMNCGCPSLDWVIVGGESGGSPERALVEKCGPVHDLWDGPHISHDPKTDVYRKHIPCDGTGWVPKPEALEWLRSIRDQCESAGVPFFFKQWGGPKPKAGGRTLAGRTWNEFPEREAVPA